MHDGAAGWGLQSNRLDSLLDYANTELNAEDFKNCYLVDYILDARENNIELLTALASHPEYFGNHIDEINVVIENISLANILEMGAVKDSLKISYNGIDYIKFKDTDFIDEIKSNRMKKLSVMGRLNINSWGSHETIQLFISDYSFKDDDSKYDF